MFTRFTTAARVLVAASCLLCPQAAKAQSFDEAVYSWQLRAAASLINPSSQDPHTLRARGILAFHRAQYAKCVQLLSQALPALSGPVATSAQSMIDKAKAAQALFAKGKRLVSESGHFVTDFANPKDLVLAPYLFEALDQAKPVLETAIGSKASEPVRFEIIQTPADLAKLTELPLDAVYKTGTIGITKYHRVMMASPRVMMRGYDWLDTAVHEYVHYLVSIRTKNRAPVWLQEGLAKFYEQSWRHQKAPPISRTQAALLHDAQTQNRWITIEQMHPSIALLPSQSDAALAYAQVQTMIAHLTRSRSQAAISKVLSLVAQGEDAKQAFGQAFGSGWDAFVRDWKQDLKSRLRQLEKARFRPQSFAANERPTLEDQPPDAFSRLGSGAARKHARLGVLLADRGHERAAILQFERALKLEAGLKTDPGLARRLGQLYLDNDQGALALRFLQRAAKLAPDDAYLATLEAMAALKAKDLEYAKQSAYRALAQNPMIPQLHCVLAKVEPDPKRRAHEERYCEDPAQEPLDAIGQDLPH